jgi:hypothetical protein
VESILSDARSNARRGDSAADQQADHSKSTQQISFDSADDDAAIAVDDL